MEYVTSEGIIVTNRVFVGSIPNWMCENKLHLAFQDLEFDVQDTRIVVDMKTGQRKGYGFVTFYNSNDAEKLVEQGYVITKDGVRLKVDTAIRKKGLQLRLQRQMNSKFSQNAMNTFTAVNNYNAYPTQHSQAQMSYVYPALARAACGCAIRPITSYQPTYQAYSWQAPTPGIPVMHYTRC